MQFSLLNTMAIGASSYDRIKITVKTNTENFGKLAGMAYGVNYELDKYYDEFGGEDPTEEKLSSLYPLARGYAESLGYTFKKASEKKSPIIAEKDVSSIVFGCIPKNRVIGMNSQVRIETEEGMEVIFETVVKVYDPEVDGTIDIMTFQLFGHPDIKMVIEDMKSLEITASGLVNMIPGILQAEAGLRTIMDVL